MTSDGHSLPMSRNSQNRGYDLSFQRAFPQGRSGGPNEGTDTAFTRQGGPIKGSRFFKESMSPAKELSGHLGLEARIWPSPPRVSPGGEFWLHGSATVRPYMGSVKPLLLPIVAQAINSSGAPHFHRNPSLSGLPLGHKASSGREFGLARVAILGRQGHEALPRSVLEIQPL